MYQDFAINPSPAYANATIQGSNLNQQALQAERNGDLQLAERLHLQAIAVKESGLGRNAVSTALSRNALGELYIKMGRLDEAEDNLKKAIAVRNHAGPAFDAAVSRDNLAQLYELRGNFKAAKDIRLSGAPENMSCGFYHCPGQLFRLNQLLRCSQCKSVWYCSKSCQNGDWRARHKKLCRAVAE
ncbi:hypothetical protein Hypma_015534 [Hypsizygus marmoreus]|uniref:MYND-type domain-containing protein n=1 Tax=Hypsizygus marmoreus TaxID=39966 RepID=A0A369K7V9_HYPMA|nr:hypothetical protein Hypma_015534 [Hypsizygus marmoreus]